MEQSNVPITLYRVASSFLVLAAIAHSLGHYLFYVNVSRFGGARRELYDVMQACAVDERFGASMWTVLQLFSLMFALLLAYAGAANLIFLRSAPSYEQIARHALFNTAFFAIAMVVIAVLHPVTQPLIITGGAVLLFAAAYLRARTATKSGLGDPL